jgi:hypothetical protein
MFLRWLFQRRRIHPREEERSIDLGDDDDDVCSPPPDRIHASRYFCFL